MKSSVNRRNPTWRHAAGVCLTFKRHVEGGEARAASCASAKSHTIALTFWGLYPSGTSFASSPPPKKTSNKEPPSQPRRRSVRGPSAPQNPDPRTATDPPPSDAWRGRQNTNGRTCVSFQQGVLWLVSPQPTTYKDLQPAHPVRRSMCVCVFQQSQSELGVPVPVPERRCPCHVTSGHPDGWDEPNHPTCDCCVCVLFFSVCLSRRPTNEINPTHPHLGFPPSSKPETGTNMSPMSNHPAGMKGRFLVRNWTPPNPQTQMTDRIRVIPLRSPEGCRLQLAHGGDSRLQTRRVS